MKLITLNIWGGYIKKPLIEFFKTYSQVDIFCLQEVYHEALKAISTDSREVCLNIFSEIKQVLPEHNAFFSPIVNNVFGLGSLIHKSIEVLDEGSINIHDNPDYPGYGPTHPRTFQWLKIKNKDQIYYVLNVHGLWNGLGKNDSPERILQSKRIKEFANSLHFPKIICGDFNLRPGTKSLKIIAQGMTNLVDEYKVQSTRTSFYPKPEKFADYIFTSPEIKVDNFYVMPNEVSDHSPLFLDYRLD